MNGSARLGDIVGTIERRLLINSWVDPAEVAPLLPSGLRPHVGPTGGVIVGCCMIEIAAARPWPVPALAGVEIRAAAHRISVEVGPEESPALAVYVPARNTDSKMAVLAGGRAFPGVHHKSKVTVQARPDALVWSVADNEVGKDSFDIAATARLHGTVATRSAVADIVVGTTLGLSPARRTSRLESVQMITEHRQASVVELLDLDSRFMKSFSTAVAAEALLMTNVNVIWRAEKPLAKI